MKREILILILTFFALQIFGQQKSMNFDTLIVNIEDKILVKISAYESAWLRDIDGFTTIISEFKSKINLIKDEIPIDKSYKLIYKKNEELIIETKSDKVYYKISPNVDKYRINECIILTEHYDIFIYFNDLDEFLRIDFQDCINQAANHENITMQGDYSTRKFHGIAWTNTVKCQKDSVEFIPEKSHYNANKSQLSIKAGVGAGIIKNQLTTDFTFWIGKFNTRKGILKHHIYISDNMYYMFSQTDNIQINNFLNLGYRFNLSNRLDKYNWIGFEAGYLTNSHGDFFKAPTFRLGTMIELRRNITLFPYIYFDDGFNKVYPGLRIGIDLGP